MRISMITLGLVFVALAPGLAGAGQTHEHDHHHAQHEAHVHGEARLAIALDDKLLAIELYSPAMNLVGFEHKPKTAAQKQAIQDAAALLQKPGKLFGWSAEANCESDEIKVDAPHAQDSHAAHDHNPHKEQTHSEFTAHYHFNCQNPAALKQMEVHLMQHFAGIEALEVQLISGKGQRQFELKRGDNRVEF